eukprot:CCRYP_006299-RC/>CCRYP_006299-RC protein AED:0.29 eAED:0.29 QI:364/1/1/1/1/1/4/125/1018
MSLRSSSSKALGRNMDLSLDALRQNARDVVSQVRTPHISPYEEWTSDELRELLVMYRISIRDSANATHEMLVRICDEVFGEITESEREAIESRRLSIKDIVVMERAAKIIQKAYLKRRARQRRRSSSCYDYHEEYMDYDFLELGREIEKDVSSLNGKSPSVAPQTPAKYRHHSVLRKINEEGEDYDEEIEVEWRKPSWKFAKRHERMVRPHRAGKQMTPYNWKTDTLGRHCFASGCGEQLDLWNEGRTSEFSQFGSGITNYFKFLKWCCWVMSILAVVHFPILIINAYGTNNGMDMSYTATMTTFGNLGSANLVNSVTIPGCDENEFQFEHCQIDKNELALVYAWIDVIGTIFFIIAWIWLMKFESKESQVLNRNVVTASDYTIRLRSIPDDTTEKELAIHFAEVTGQAIAAVHLAFNNSKEIRMYIKRGMIMQQRYKCVQRIRYEKTVNDGKPGQKKRLRKLMCEREDLTMAVRAKDDQRSKVIPRNQRAIEAFVTFETETGFIEAMMKYHLNWFRTCCCCYPERLKFKGMRLSVERAPEPSTIMWENLEYSRSSRTFRKCLTTGVALMAILFSVILTFLARDFKSKVLLNASKPCPDGFFDQSLDYQLELISNDIDLSHCYCSALSVTDQWNIHHCHDNINAKAKATAMGYSAGFIVVFMNAFFTWLMDKAGVFEKHQSLDKMETSNMVRVFLLKFVNTGCLVLLYGQQWLQRLVRIHFEDASEFNVDWYATGGTSLMIVMLLNIVSPHVGAFVGYFRHRAKIRRLEKNLTADQETNDSHRIWYTQEELNDFYRGPPFKLNYRYSQVLVTIYICWMYAVSMPIMPLFGAVSCYISYWVDKFLFCNFYRTPPMYSDEMGKTSTKLLGYLVVVHLGMSMWMMGCEEIFVGEPILDDPYSDKLNHVGSAQSTFLGKLRKKHLVPLEGALLIFVAGILLSKISSTFIRRVCGFLRCMTCSKSSEVKNLTASMNTVQVDYSSARDREIIKGLATYNILQNPKYQEAFAITPEFAANHNRVR